MPEMSRDKMRRGVVGKYYARVMEGSNLVRIAPDLLDAFPNEAAVNRALHELLEMRGRVLAITEPALRKRKTA